MDINGKIDSGVPRNRFHYNKDNTNFFLESISLFLMVEIKINDIT
jgi:hypothetical protein